MLIADSQVHVWTSGRKIDPANAHHLQQAVFSMDDLLPRMDQAGVDRAVLVPPSWDSNDHALEAARLHPTRFAVMGRLALELPESRSRVPSWRDQTGMLGLRLTFNNAEREAWLVNGTADWIWPAAQSEGLPIMVWVAGSLPAMPMIAERHPELKLVIDHLGIRRNTKDAEAFADLPDLLKLARYPNVAVKASGMAGFSSEPYPFRGLENYLRRTFDAFGPHRFFWGTDLTRMKISYRQCVTHFTEELPWLSDDDKQLVMGRALCNWLGWDAPAERPLSSP